MRKKLTAALKEAMLNKDALRLSTLRLINAAIKDQEIARRGKDDNELSEADIMVILDKMIKQRKESAKLYEEAGRLDTAEAERSEIIVIQEFLPKQLSEDEMNKAINAAVEEAGVDSIRGMGQVMKLLKSQYTGQMDFGEVGAKLKERLG